MLKLFVRLLGMGILLMTAVANAAQFKTYFKDGDIWISDANGSHAKKLTHGSWPDLSSDDKRIVFNTDEDKDSTVTRRIAIIDVQSKKITVLKNIPSNNSFDPNWSPDNHKILFNTFLNGVWQVAVIDADDKNYRVLKNTKDVYQPVWAVDGKSFFCHDITYIYWVDLDGKIIKKWDVSVVFPKGALSSASELDVSPDGKQLIVEVDMLDQKPVAGSQEPPVVKKTIDLK